LKTQEKVLPKFSQASENSKSLSQNTNAESFAALDNQQKRSAESQTVKNKIKSVKKIPVSAVAYIDEQPSNSSQIRSSLRKSKDK